jgi:hypothetical protein
LRETRCVTAGGGRDREETDLVDCGGLDWCSRQNEPKAAFSRMSELEEMKVALYG